MQHPSKNKSYKRKEFSHDSSKNKFLKTNFIIYFDRNSDDKILNVYISMLHTIIASVLLTSLELHLKFVHTFEKACKKNNQSKVQIHEKNRSY